ncbi:hypothetical protein HDV06_005682 [Boothiomyces sp. JEL0866]|nr:hypothetical protein HDV06_005682 [Boothiomyces sp. JEL0866]
MTNITVQLALAHHLPQILYLSKINNKKNLSPDELSGGFTTAEYQLEFLQQLQKETPPVVALQDDKVVGYIIVCSKDLSGGHPYLVEFVDKIERKDYMDFTKVKYLLVAQVCVAKESRGKGLLSKMYTVMQDQYQDFDCAIADVDLKNEPSKKAHYKSGWKVFGQEVYGGIPCEFIIKEF